MNQKMHCGAGDSFLTHRPDSFYKGKSFNYVGQWTEGDRYFSDEFVVDYVSFENCFLACAKTHTASLSNMPVLIYDENALPIGVNGDDWQFVMRGGTNSTAYDIAVEHGYTGTEEEWIKMIQKQVVTGAELDPSVRCAPDLDLENVVRFDVDQTAKSAIQKAQARKNIDAAWDEEILIAEEPSIDYYQANRTLDQIALVWEPQQLTQEQLAQAQENLHIADEVRVDILEQKMAELDEKGLTTLGNINDISQYTNKDRTATEPGERPKFFVDAINNYVGRVGDPVQDNIKKAGLAVAAGFTNDTIGSLNYLFNICGVKILDVTPTSDKSGRIWYALCDRNNNRIIGSEIFKIPRDNEIHDVRIIEGGLDDSDPDNPKYVEGGAGHYWLRFISGYFDETKGEWIDSEPVYCLVDRMFYVAKEEEKPYTDYTEPLSEANENPLYEGATIQTKIEDDPLTGFRNVSAELLEATVDRLHLNKEGRLNYDFTGYDFTMDPSTAEDYYVRCSQDYPGAIRLMPSNYNEIGPKMRPPYQPGELYYTYVRHLTVGQELNTVAQTLRDAVNELNDRYPVSIVTYENGVYVEEPDPADPTQTIKKTATPGSSFTYVVKQRNGEDSTELIDIAKIEVPLDWHVVSANPFIALGDEWLGRYDLPEDQRTDPLLRAEEGDSLLKIGITNNTKEEDPDTGELIDVIEYIYTRMNVYFVKDEVTDNEVKMFDPTDPTQDKLYENPEAVLADFETVPQIQLYISGYDNELSAKILFEDDRLPGKEIIP